MVGCCHGVPFHSVFVEHFDAVHHLLPGAIALNVVPISIVLLLCAVDADAHEPSFVVKKAAPFGREQQAIGLDAVADAFASPVILLQAHGLFVETEGFEHGFATMPCKEYVRGLLELDIVADVMLQQFVAHAALLSLGQMLFLQIIAVLAAQVTQWSCRFCHYV